VIGHRSQSRIIIDSAHDYHAFLYHVFLLDEAHRRFVLLPRQTKGITPGGEEMILVRDDISKSLISDDAIAVFG